MNVGPRRFLSTWAAVFVCALASLATFNVAVDPYLLFDTRRVPGFNTHKSENVYPQELMIKAYDAPRQVPRTIVLGSSVVDFGLDALDPAWPERVRPVYNLGFIGGGAPSVGHLYLQYLLAQQDLELVVLGLDFLLFLRGEAAAKNSRFSDPAVKARLTVGHDYTRTRRRALDALQASISLDATLHSISTVAASIGMEGANFIGGNAPVVSFLPPVPASDLLMSAYYQQTQIQMDSTEMPFVRAILDLCKRRGIDVIVLINPMHADALEIYDQAGLWKIFEDWKREIVAMTSEQDELLHRHGVRLWDFTGYNANTIGIATSGEAANFWIDNVHYNKPLGNRMLRRMFSEEDSGFGVLLGRANVEEHMHSIRHEQKMYRQNYPEDARRVSKINEDARQFRWE